MSKNPTFFETLMPDLEEPIFALGFGARSARSIGSPSIEFGHLDRLKFSGELATTPINRSTNRWTAEGILFSVRGKLINESASLVFGMFPMSIACDIVS